MKSQSMLLVGLEAKYRDHLCSCAARRGVRVYVTDHELPSPENSEDPALCVVALKQDEESFFDPIRALRRAFPPAAVVVVVQEASVETVVQLMRMGVRDVVSTLAPPEDLARSVCMHLDSAARPSGMRRIVGTSAPMLALKSQIQAVSSLDSTVLLTGETGTGKGLVARVLHELSKRSRGPFVHVDCAALSPTVIESELFGHERGAFTGAVARRPGRFELAGNGTIFLDEIGDLDVGLQAKLLRVLEDRAYERIGGTATLRMVARVIAATSRDLPRAVAAGHFRADLYFRVAVVHLRIPALRQRLLDIPLLARSGLREIAARLGVVAPEASEEFITKLMTHTWPGNVRELMNLLERVLARNPAGILQGRDLEEALLGSMALPEPRETWAPSSSERGANGPGPDPARAQIARELIATGGNVSRTARRLGLPRSTLRYRIHLLGLKGLIPED
jgi:DNA-binding NtrC family response regulator